MDFTQFCPLSCGAVWCTPISPLSLLLWSVCVVHCDYSSLDRPTVVVTCDTPVDVRADQYRLIVGGQRLSILSLWFLLCVAAVLIVHAHMPRGWTGGVSCLAGACKLAYMYVYRSLSFVHGVLRVCLSDPSILSGKQNYPYFSAFMGPMRKQFFLGCLGSVVVV